MARYPKLRGHGLRPAQSYSPQEIASATAVPETTIQSWIRQGKLPAMTNGNPHLVLGSDLQAFFEDLRKTTEVLQKDEFRCMHCRTGRKAMGGMADILLKPGAQMGRLEALCESCGGKMNRGFSARDLPRLATIFDLRLPGRAGN